MNVRLEALTEVHEMKAEEDNDWKNNNMKGGKTIINLNLARNAPFALDKTTDISLFVRMYFLNLLKH